MDGRKELFEELKNTEQDVRQYIAEQFVALQAHRDFEHFLDGNITEGGRPDIVRRRIEDITDFYQREG